MKAQRSTRGMHAYMWMGPWGNLGSECWWFALLLLLVVVGEKIARDNNDNLMYHNFNDTSIHIISTNGNFTNPYTFVQCTLCWLSCNTCEFLFCIQCIMQEKSARSATHPTQGREPKVLDRTCATKPVAWFFVALTGPAFLSCSHLNQKCLTEPVRLNQWPDFLLH